MMSCDPSITNQSDIPPLAPAVWPVSWQPVVDDPVTMVTCMMTVEMINTVPSDHHQLLLITMELVVVGLLTCAS